MSVSVIFLDFIFRQLHHLQIVADLFHFFWYDFNLFFLSYCFGTVLDKSSGRGQTPLPCFWLYIFTLFLTYYFSVLWLLD